MIFPSSAAVASSSNVVMTKLLPVLAMVIGLGIIVSVAVAQGMKTRGGDSRVTGNPRRAYVLGGSFFVWGVLALIASFYSDGWFATLVSLGLGLLLSWCGLSNIRIVFRGTVPIRARVEKHNSYKNGYTPVFAYRYEGQEYHIQSQHAFGYRRAMRDFAVGSEVEIFIDPVAPENCTPIKRVRVGDVLLALFGLAFIGLGLFLLISNAQVSIG